MPKLCSAGGCSNHHYQHEKKLSFHVFPDREKEPERRQRWIWACGRQNPDGSRWKPTAKYIYLCSEHFLSGKPSKDPDNIDYVPSLFNFNKTPKTEEKNKKKKSCFNSAHFVDKNGPTYQYPDPLPAESCSERETSKMTRDLYTSKRKGPKSTRKRLRNEILDPFTADPCSIRETRKSTRKRSTNELPDPPSAVQCDKANEKTPKSAEKPPAKKCRLEHDGPRPLSIHDARPVLMYISEHQQFVIKQVFQQLNWNYQVLVLTPAEVEILKFLSQISTKSTKSNSATTGKNDGNSTVVSTIKTGCQTETSGIMNDDSTVVSTVQVGDKDEKFVIEVVKDEEYVERKPDIGVKETVKTFSNSDNVKETGHVFPNNTNMKETVHVFPNNANMKETVQTFPNNIQSVHTLPNNMKIGNPFSNNIQSVNPSPNFTQSVNHFPNNKHSDCTKLQTSEDHKMNVDEERVTVQYGTGVNAGYQYILLHDDDCFPGPPPVPVQPLLVTSKPDVVMQRVNSEPVVAETTGKVYNEGHNTVHVGENNNQKPHIEASYEKAHNLKIEEDYSCPETKFDSQETLVSDCKSVVAKTDVYNDWTKADVDSHEHLINDGKIFIVKREVSDGCDESYFKNHKPLVSDFKTGVVKSEVFDGFDKIECVNQMPNTELLTYTDANVKMEAVSTATLTCENISEERIFPNVKVEVEDDGYNQALND